jgi:DNA-binding GntR family transcriptional regulator
MLGATRTAIMTLAEKAYVSLRKDIVEGACPESPLRLADLSERYGMGFSPLREALNRLQAERLVTAESLRGFRVSARSLAEFEDALRARLLSRPRRCASPSPAGRRCLGSLGRRHALRTALQQTKASGR